MQRLNWFFVLNAGVIACLLQSSLLADQPQAVAVTSVGEAVVHKDKMKLLPEGKFAVSGAEFKAVWTALGLEEGKRPKVDFNNTILLIESKDNANRNGVRYHGRLHEGNFELLAISTLIGFPSSDQRKLTFLTVPRKGIKSVARVVTKRDDKGRFKSERKLFPVKQQIMKEVP